MTSERELLGIVRESLGLYFARQEERANGVMAKMERDAIDTMKAILDIVDSMPRQERIWLTNNVNGIIEGSEALSGSTFNVERFIEIRELFIAFKSWLYTPISVKGLMIAPILIMSREGNPPAKWGVPDEEPEQLQDFVET